MRPAYLIEMVRKLFPSIQVEKPEELPGLMQVQTLEDGRDSLVQGLRKFADARMEKDGEEERDFPASLSDICDAGEYPGMDP